MSNSFLIHNAIIVNEGKVFNGSLVIKNGIIDAIFEGEVPSDYPVTSLQKIDAEASYLLPGIIDDQVHFREPGLTYKADIYTESRAAVAGGITSFMEMPNTVPNTLTQELLEEKFKLASQKSLANYSFYMGASNDNLEEVVKTNPKTVCGIKVFMGSSTGNMLVDDSKVLESIFAKAPTLVAVHCEDESRIQQITKELFERYGEEAPTAIHSQIRDAEACFLSSSKAVALAQKHHTRLHVLHLSSAKEMELFDNNIPLEEKRITAEVCLHHLWFTDADYATKGNLIKWNPAVKSAVDKEALWEALLDDKIDVIATDHAPHSLEEKQRPYFLSPSGGPMVQHLLPAMMEFVRQGKISITKLVEKMCHNPALIFQIDKRGFIRQGYHADLVLVNPNRAFEVGKENLFYKCGWSPLEGETLSANVTHTFVNGNLVYENGVFFEQIKGQALLFNR